MQDVSVAIVGAGSVGLVLAAELALQGIDVAVFERRPSQRLAGSRAGGLQARTIEVFDQRGIAERFVSAGTTAQVQAFGGTILDISDFPSRHPYGLGLWQNKIEDLLADWVGQLGVNIRYGHAVTEVVQQEDGVVLRFDSLDDDGAGGGRDDVGDEVRAQYVVGCDGGRSTVRKVAGIAFEGWEATVSNLIAEVEYGSEPEWGMRVGSKGVHGITRIEEGRDTIRIVLTEDELRLGAEPSLDDLREAMRAIWGTDFGVHSPTWISRFTDAARQAVSYRAGRILIAGDAAHVHYPAGGQGLNIGVQDAVNLGWKLALVARGLAPESLLDSYEAERRPIAARVLQDTLAQVALRQTDARSKAVAGAVAELLTLDQGRKRFGARLSGLGVHYDLGGSGGDAHPLVGRRMPDLPLLVDGAPLRAFELMHTARPLLISFGSPDHDLAIAEAWAGRIEQISARYDGDWELPELGVVSAPNAVFVRPDGYVAWAGDSADEDGDNVDPDGAAALTGALTRWLGAPTGE